MEHEVLEIELSGVNGYLSGIVGGISSQQAFLSDWYFIIIGIGDHLNIWSDFLACHEIWIFSILE